MLLPSQKPVFALNIYLRHQSVTSFLSSVPRPKKNPGSAPIFTKQTWNRHNWYGRSKSFVFGPECSDRVASNALGAPDNDSDNKHDNNDQHEDCHAPDHTPIRLQVLRLKIKQ